MSIVIISDRDPKAWIRALKNRNPDLDLRVYPHDSNREEVEYALVWNHPPGVFTEYPNLKVVASMGAGVDHILRDPELPANIILTRIVDEQLATDMAEFVLALVMDHLRNLSFHQQQENLQQWKPASYLRISEVEVGIMGMGNLGLTVAKKLSLTGFRVHGWARSAKDVENIKVYTGRENLPGFLARSPVLVCLLPLTANTENILDKQLFRQLPQNAFLINVARGGHLVEEDLLEMIRNGHLRGAALDVFTREPLPGGHPFWKDPRIKITPHIASVTKPVAVVSQVLDNYNRMKQSEPLKNTVEQSRGY